MSDLRQQRDAARTERDQLRRHNAHLRAIVGDIAPEYADAYSLLCDIALNPTRGDDLGTTTTGNTFESRTPRHNTAAYRLRNEERRAQRKRAATLRTKIAHITGGIDDHPLAETYEVASSDAPLPRPTTIFVYFCQSTQGGPIKIGVALDPATRLRDLQAASPTQLQMLAVIPGGYDTEKRLHEHFSEWRLHGEWFDPGAEGLSELVAKAQSQHPYRQHATLTTMTPAYRLG